MKKQTIGQVHTFSLSNFAARSVERHRTKRIWQKGHPNQRLQSLLTLFEHSCWWASLPWSVSPSPTWTTSTCSRLAINSCWASRSCWACACRTTWSSGATSPSSVSALSTHASVRCCTSFPMRCDCFSSSFLRCRRGCDKSGHLHVPEHRTVRWGRGRLHSGQFVTRYAALQTKRKQQNRVRSCW